MTITLRSTKGSALTHNELDGNFVDLNSRVAKADNARTGLVDYNDLATQSASITLPGGVFTAMTNDKLGPSTITTYFPEGVTTLFNSTTNQFDFSELSLGDQVFFRFDFIVTTTANNTDVTARFRLGIDDPNEYTVPIFGPTSYKTAGTRSYGFWSGVYMGDDHTLNDPGAIEIMADKNSSIVVNGWYSPILIRGEV